MSRCRYVGLLGSLPATDWKIWQSGDPPVLLAEKTTPPTSDLEAHSENADNEQIIPISPKVPFYRTRKGIIVIVVLVVVIAVAAIAGGVVVSKQKQVSSCQGSKTPGKTANTNTKTVVITVHAMPTTPTPVIYPSTYVPDPISPGGLITAGIWHCSPSAHHLLVVHGPRLFYLIFFLAISHGILLSLTFNLDIT